MAKTVTTNYSGVAAPGNAFNARISSDSDAFARNDADALGYAFELHTHASGLGLAVALTAASNFSGDVTLTTQNTYYDGPSMAQGSTGTWYASGSVVVVDTVGATTFNAKLWDGTTVIASGRVVTSAATLHQTISLSGSLATPAGNIRISVTNATRNGGTITTSASGNGRDSVVSGFRIA